MDALAHVHVLQEPSDLTIGVTEVLVVRQIHGLLFDGADEPLNVSVSAGLADFRHADLELGALQELHVVGTGALHSLIGVMDLRLGKGQGAVQSRHRQFTLEAASQVPSAAGIALAQVVEVRQRTCRAVGIEHQDRQAANHDGWADPAQLSETPVSTSTATPTETPSPTPSATAIATPTATAAGNLGAPEATFVYDGDGNRVLGTVDGVTTAYVGDHYEIEGPTVRKYYTAGGQRVALREDGALYFLITDHLGSTTVTASESGALAGEQRYKAFGETRYAAGETATTFRYTGQREEPGIGLYYYRARWYDAGLGRFVQADTIVPAAGTPGALDRYAYVFNNPLRYTDPSGHCAMFCIPLALFIIGFILSVPSDTYQSPERQDISAAQGYVGLALMTGGAVLFVAPEVAPAALATAGRLAQGAQTPLGQAGIGGVAEACLVGSCTPGEIAVSAAENLLLDAPGIAGPRIFRSASGSPDSMTPRPGIDDVPGGGLTFWDSVDPISPGSKYAEVDTSLLQALRPIPDGNPPGHVTVRPQTDGMLQEWAASRGTGVVHPLTQELLDSVVRMGRKPQRQ